MDILERSSGEMSPLLPGVPTGARGHHGYYY